MNDFFKRTASIGKLGMHSASFLLSLPPRLVAGFIFVSSLAVKCGEPTPAGFYLLDKTRRWTRYAEEGIKDNWNFLNEGLYEGCECPDGDSLSTPMMG